MTDEELLEKFQPRPGETLEHSRQLFQARFSPCGKYLVAPGYDALVHRWDVSGDAPAAMPALAGHHAWVQALAFAPTSDLVYSADSWGRLAAYRYAEQQAAAVWSNDAAHPGWIRALAVSPNGEMLATAGNEPVVRLWSAADGKPLGELPGHAKILFSLAFHPDGKSLVTGDLYGKLRDWDLESRKIVRELDASSLYQFDKIQECGGARHLAFNADGTRLLCAGQKTPGGGFAVGLPCVLLYDWAAGTQLQEMQFGANDEGFVYDARFHPAGFIMAASCAFPGKGQLWFWQPDSDKPFYVGKDLPNGRSVSLHPDGQRLAYLVCISQNQNGRGVPGEAYAGGSAKIHLLRVNAA